MDRLEALLRRCSLQLRIPSLVILDVMMPGMDGVEVLRRVRSEPKNAHLPVVMFSAIDGPEPIQIIRRSLCFTKWDAYSTLSSDD